MSIGRLSLDNGMVILAEHRDNVTREKAVYTLATMLKRMFPEFNFNPPDNIVKGTVEVPIPKYADMERFIRKHNTEVFDIIPYPLTGVLTAIAIRRSNVY